MTAQHLLLAVSAAALLVVCLNDIAARMIPDGASLLLLLAGSALRLLDGSLPLAAACAFALFAACAIPFLFGKLGGGDVKLVGAVTLLIPPGSVPDMVVATTYWGGAMCVAYLLLRWAVPALAPLPRPVPSNPRAQPLLRRALRAESWRIRRHGSVPYGFAISAGVLTTLFNGLSSGPFSGGMP